MENSFSLSFIPNDYKMIVEFAAVSLSTAILIAASILPYIGLRRGVDSPRSSGRPKALNGLALSNCFACGIFLGTCFLGLIPHVQMQEGVILKQLNISDPHSQEYPYLRTNFVILAGFLTILLIEQIAFICAPSPSQSTILTDAHYHHPEQAATSTTRQNNGLHDADINEPLVNLDSDSDQDDLEEIQFRTVVPSNAHHLHDHSDDEHEHGHHHHILPGETGSIEYILLLIALSVHSIFEGIALGAQQELNGFMKFLLSVMVHEVLCSFAYGVSLSKQRIPLKKALGSILFLSFSLPIGILVMAWVGFLDTHISMNKGEGYCFFDETLIWNNIYASTSNLKIKNEFYEIWDTFKMDSQIAAEKNTAAKIENGKEFRKRKRSKKKNDESGGAKFLSERSKIVENIWKQFVEDDAIIKNEEKITAENNKIARETAKKVKDFEWIEKLSTMDLTELDTVEIEDRGSYKIITNKLKLFKNDSDKCVRINVDDEDFVIPPEAEFIPGPVEAVKHLDYADKKFDCIIMDPPWPNRSVKRLKTYNTFQIDDLYDLPIDSLCASSKTPVIIWLTNNSAIHSTIDSILESWGLKKYGIFHWLKVTKNGEPIFPFGSNHKVPFESFIIAFPESEKSEEKEKEKEKNFMIENDFCFISTPNSCHSRKPPIAAILEQLIPDMRFDKSLELYGRYLCPKTTSIGFEILKFQHCFSNFVLNDNK
uniref:Uncharacterized protein n=1 Tax=Panagrolaimus sp. ES5 TaxID=591445 RepID=A0AC34GT72_9BILA